MNLSSVASETKTPDLGLLNVGLQGGGSRRRGLLPICRFFEKMSQSLFRLRGRTERQHARSAMVPDFGTAFRMADEQEIFQAKAFLRRHQSFRDRRDRLFSVDPFGMPCPLGIEETIDGHRFAGKERRLKRLPGAMRRLQPIIAIA